jgi:hypothetical protein
VPDQDDGQSLIDLRDWMRANRVDEITLLSFGRVDPAAYEINARSVDEPLGQYVAISKSFLTGLPAQSRGRFILLRNWRKLAATRPTTDLGGIVIYPAAATGPEPWVHVVNSWNEATQDPAMQPIENFQQRTAELR